MSADPRVHAAIESIYARFAAPTPRAIEGCPCCVGTRRVDVLLSKPLRELSGRDLWRYVTGAFLTIGAETDFRYLLPRILELAACGGETPNPEIVLGKLDLAGWSAWTAHERNAVVALIDAWFDQALEEDLRLAEEEGFLSVPDCESVLCGAARAGLDLSPWLARLTVPRAEPVRAALAEQHARALAGGVVPRGFWEEAPAGWRALAGVLAPA